MKTIRKRDHYYLVEKIYTELVLHLLPLIGRTPLTPNQITLANYLNAVIVLVLIIDQWFLPAAMLIQLYLVLDILDGNLARYKQQFSKLGAKLDNIGDRFFYNAIMIAIGWATQMHWGSIMAFLIAHNAHSYIATTYIVPRIRKARNFKRFAIKQWLMDKGYILGMDLSFQAAIVSILLLTPYREWALPITTALYGLDLTFRLIEVQLQHPTHG